MKKLIEKIGNHIKDIKRKDDKTKRNTIMKSNININKSMIESMMGHQLSITLDESYFRPTRENLFAEFKKGIEALTIF